MMNSLKGKVVLVTGAAGGIGSVICEQVVEAGGILVASDYTQEALDAANVQAEYTVVANLFAQDGADQIFDQVDSIGLHVDYLVNCAGITRDALFDKMADEQIDEVLMMNLTQSIKVSQRFYKRAKAVASVVTDNRNKFVYAQMVKAGNAEELPADTSSRDLFKAVKALAKSENGAMVKALQKQAVTDFKYPDACVIMVSSINKRGQAGQVNYAATKAGVVAAAHSIAMEGAKLGIRANSIAPGYTATPMVTAIRENVLDGIIATIPIQRLCEPAEIASGVMFALSNKAMTGETININGGLSME